MNVTVNHGDPRELTLLAVNARYMRHEQFQQLVANIKRDGGLSSTPFVWIDQQRRIVLSGNHRVEAAIEAGVSDIHWLETSDPLTRDQQIAIQLSHNSLVGQDDPALLAQLYEQIEDLDLRQYAGLDDRELDLIAEVSVGTLSEANLDYATLNLTFLPDDADKARRGFEEADALATDADERWLARLADHMRLLEDIAKTSRAHNVKNRGAGLALLLDVFEAHQTDLQRGYYDPDQDRALHNGWVPLASILNSDHVPVADAITIAKAVDKMVNDGEVPNVMRWQAIAMLATRYLDT